MTTQSKTNIAILPLHECFEAIIANKDAPALNYCVNYAQYGLLMLLGRMPLRDANVRTQILYVLNNMTHWRGDTAKQVRASLKHHEKELSK